MKWNRFRLKTTTEAEDIVSSILADLGVEGVEIEDKVPLTAADKEQMFVDILPETEVDDGCGIFEASIRIPRWIEQDGRAACQCQTGIRRNVRVYGFG